MKDLKSLQINVEAYLERKRASMMKLFVKIVKNLLFSQKNSITDAPFGSKEAAENNEFSRRSIGGANHRDCYNAWRFLFLE